jgi:hypothetical protein
VRPKAVAIRPTWPWLTLLDKAARPGSFNGFSITFGPAGRPVVPLPALESLSRIVGLRLAAIGPASVFSAFSFPVVFREVPIDPGGGDRCTLQFGHDSTRLIAIHPDACPSSIRPARSISLSLFRRNGNLRFRWSKCSIRPIARINDAV